MTFFSRELLLLGAPLFVLIVATCRSSRPPVGQDSNESGEKRLFLSYRVGGGMDIYSDGDRYGHQIDLYVDRTYHLYRLIYRKAEENQQDSIQKAKVTQGQLEEATFTSLQAKVDSLQLSSIPKHLPNVNPHKVEIRGPAESVVLKVRSSPSQELVEIQSNMGADREHYPQPFLQLHDRLEQLTREMKKRKED